MKNKSILFVVALCAGLQVNMGFASQNQSWTDWVRAKFATAQKTAAEKYYNVRDMATVGLSGAATVATTKAFEPSLRSGLSLITSSGTGQIMLLAIGTGLIFTTFVSICNQLTGKSKVDNIKTLKVALAQVLGNSLLYPTRSSKIHALLKQDNDIWPLIGKYVATDKEDIVQEACAELSKEITSVFSYPEEQRAIDRAIDAKMAKFRGIIVNIPKLQDKIVALEQFLMESQVFDVPTMQAYLSVYFRLKNTEAATGTPVILKFLL